MSFESDSHATRGQSDEESRIDRTFPMDGHPFGLCLTHDIDRPYKTKQALYYALTDRSAHHFRAFLPNEYPWWQFEQIMSMEADLGVRSAFYVLREPHILSRPPTEWLDSVHLIEHLGRYDPADPDLVELFRELERGGWEIGLHASYGSHRDADRLRMEKEALEALLGHDVHGIRHHRLEFDPPETWALHRELGFRYDTSLGSSADVGFEYGDDVFRPFGDDFVSFPMTIMEKALPADPDEAWAVCERILSEAYDRNAVVTVLWHPRNFNERDFPGQATLYRRLIERAQELGAWVGSPKQLYERLDLPADEKAGTQPNLPSEARDPAGVQ